MKDTIAMYHIPCDVVGEVSQNYNHLLCLACGKWVDMKAHPDEVGVRNFPDWWIRNPDPYGYPYREY